MGTIKKGILGGFSGKVGPVVGATWRGKDVMRSLPKKGQHNATQEQLVQRLKFKLVSRFLTPLKSIVGACFGENANDKSKMNLAMSYHITDAITGVYPVYKMDYPKVIISKGGLLGAENIQASAVGTATLKLTWQDNSGQGQAKATDTFVVVAYDGNGNYSEYRAQAQRSDATYTMVLPAYLSGATVQCWATFISADQKLYANSVYLGGITLQ